MIIQEMSELELAELFLQLARLREKVKEVEEQIKDQVISKKSSMKFAGVVATYYQPSKEWDYETAVKEAIQNGVEVDLKAFTTITERVCWKDACEDLMLEQIPYQEKPERVVLK